MVSLSARVVKIPGFRFIEKFGTHVIVGLKMGGKDVIYVKQAHSSNIQSADLQRRLKEIADKHFRDENEHFGMDCKGTHEKEKVCNTSFIMLMTFF